MCSSPQAADVLPCRLCRPLYARRAEDGGPRALCCPARWPTCACASGPRHSSCAVPSPCEPTPLPPQTSGWMGGWASTWGGGGQGLDEGEADRQGLDKGKRRCLSRADLGLETGYAAKGLGEGNRSARAGDAEVVLVRRPVRQAGTAVTRTVRRLRQPRAHLVQHGRGELLGAQRARVRVKGRLRAWREGHSGVGRRAGGLGGRL